jgi:Protein of unknown function (DUF2599)
VIDGNPAALAYPVVADPYFFVDLIDHFSWTHTINSSGRYRYTMSVWPTPWAIFNSGYYRVAEYGWEELVNKDTYHTINTNVGGMHDQYDCHQILFVGVIRLPSGAVYHLDEFKQNVGLPLTMAYGCNPPDAW